MPFLVMEPTGVRRSVHDAVFSLCPHPQPDVLRAPEAGKELKEAMGPSRIDPRSPEAGMRTPNPCDHPAPRGHPHDEGVVPTRVSEAVEPTDEPAVLPFDLVVRVDDQREEALLLVLPQMDVAQVQPTGGIVGVVMVEEVGGRWRARRKDEGTKEDPPSPKPGLRFWNRIVRTRFWPLAGRSPIPSTGSLLTTASPKTIRERGMLLEAPVRSVLVRMLR
jgi:hypothetical protein